MDIIVIPDLFKAVAAKVNEALSTRATDPFTVYFDYGHYNEVTRNLTSKDGSVSQKGKKYPLIWLVMDFVEKVGATTDYCELPDLQILIATVTTPAITAAQRIEKTFKPRLYPIYSELMDQIEQSGYFSVGDAEAIPHERILRPYWGGQDGFGNGTANLFNDFIDAIQIRKLKLNVNESVCDEFNLLS
jgi:hypothetical protein